MAAHHHSLALDLFEDMNRKVEEASKDFAEGDGDTKIVEEIESLCMNCHENGTTKLLLTKIPFFREIVIMSFDCPSCNFKNSEVQPAGQIQERGSKYIFKVENVQDMSRQIIKSDTCILRIEELDLEIPPGRGQLSNVEGIINMVQSDLSEKQTERKEVVPEIYEKLQIVIGSLVKMVSGENFPFTITVDDPAGNSWIEPSTSDKKGKYSHVHYARRTEQNAALGLADTTGEENGGTIRPEYHATELYPQLPANAVPTAMDQDQDEIVENQVYSFPASCPGCTKHCVTNMKMVNIPYFKQVVLMSTVCDLCGYRSNEVKTGGEVPEKGRRIALNVRNPEDLARDILKSESCAMQCPELNLNVTPGTLGGRFTTVEGLLTQVRDDLRASIFDTDDVEAVGGDSMDTGTKKKWQTFFSELTSAIEGRKVFTIILEDPLASSYVQSYTAPDPDSQLEVSDYDRTWDEEEDLGLHDIKVEDYEQPEAGEKKTEETTAER
ncbi:zf-ZPR1-domain-containing protein [Patellaria atrata CBS 101060]|uniref:Zf-ZPR1-domain-containing protein n=1 Tax=Patellaria atrata CBS 101060 TaxID=1346257 RepID=A0A9P4SGZ6_9PEZI|nr:zf-ZPR1-domain-containing protein [Patellaria atrata CBS 101060]